MILALEILLLIKSSPKTFSSMNIKYEFIFLKSFHLVYSIKKGGGAGTVGPELILECPLYTHFHYLHCLMEPQVEP